MGRRRRGGAAHSVAWRRAARQRADAAEHALAAAGVVGADDRERYVWAKLLVQTRAFLLKGGGHAICPVLDLATILARRNVRPAAGRRRRVDEAAKYTSTRATR